MTAHELVIRLGRSFDISVNGRFIEHVREITVPFDFADMAEAARSLRLETRPATGHHRGQVEEDP